MDRMKQAVTRTRENLAERIDAVVSIGKEIDRNTLDDLEATLLSADLGTATTQQVLSTLREKADRKHAHILMEDGEYRLCDDASEFGTSVFRDGRSIELLKGNRRGEKLRAGDEIYLGRACVR